jgi:hypothetical protein
LQPNSDLLAGQGLQVWVKALDDLAREDKYGGKPMTERDYLSELDPALRARYRQNDSYDAQYKELARTFDEVLSKDPKVPPKHPVIFKDSWEKVLQHVKEWKPEPPASQEVWLAQEDYWIQRELLLALREANKSVARFKKVKAGDGIDPNDPLQGSFENADWHLDLIVVKTAQGFSFKGRITNPDKWEDGLLRPKRVQAIGELFFWLYLDKDPEKDRTTKPVAVSIQGGSLAPGKSQEIRETPLLVELAPQGIFRVEQVLEPRLSPIKRIDHLVIGQPAQSHRTYLPALKPPRGLNMTLHKPTKEGPKGGGPAAKGEMPIPTTENGLVMQRCCSDTGDDKTPVPVRRIPAGLVLVVDQTHIPEILGALVSSRLRFQVTQVTWQHFSGALGAGEDGQKPIPKGGPGPDLRPGEKHGEEVSNLVELTIYGVASLYERPSDKKPTDKKTPDKKGDLPRDRKDRKLPKDDVKKAS